MVSKESFKIQLVGMVSEHLVPEAPRPAAAIVGALGEWLGYFTYFKTFSTQLLQEL